MGAASPHRRTASLPEEPLRNACVGALSVADNIGLRSFDVAPALHLDWMRGAAVRERARALIQAFGVKTRSELAPIRARSGGNVQRAVQARANSPEPIPMTTVAARPGPFTFDAAHTALVMIDMQRDFIEPGGFGATLGNDVSLLRPVVQGAAELVAWARTRGLLIVHTQECHRADLSDCPPAKRLRGLPSLRIGDMGSMGRILIDGEPGADFVPQLAFYATELTAVLEARHITHLIFGGVTTEVCVQSTMREANDRGYECLLIEEATGSYFPEFKEQTLAMVRAQGGIVGWTAKLAALTGA